ncbi:MAG TPA: FGGY family carbohydrate kinase [Kiritimatiellia bacterium]|nr:FGGY family carbohydrate kinase [Kiritimatiellia bacterium]
MDGKKVFAVDLGASGGKCFVGVFSDKGFRMEEIHRFAHEGVSCFLPDRSGEVTERTFWDDTFIYQNIVKGLQAARRQCGAVLDGIGIDTWGADGNLVTRDGDLLGKVYCYRDHRLDAMCEEVKARLDATKVYEITGNHFQPFNQSNQLLWLATRRPELLKLAEVYLPIPSLFYYYLGGCKVVDSTFASVTQMMDAKRGKWSREMLKALGIPKRLMPEIVKPGTKVGRLQPKLAAACGLNEADLIAVGSHDTASAFAAAPVRNVKTALIISSGTWSLVGKLIRKPITTPEAMAAGLSNEGGIGNTRFLRNCMGTWIVQELLRVWEIADGKRMSWSEVDTLTPAAPAFTAFIDPDDSRFYNPANMEQEIRAYLNETGQPAPVDRGTVLRCVYESLALKYRQVNETINRVTGTDTEAVHIVGGGSNNALLNQFTADSVGVPVFAGPKEATAVGNLMVQAVGAGILPDLKAAKSIIRASFPITVFQPQQTDAWDAAYARFSSFVHY